MTRSYYSSSHSSDVSTVPVRVNDALQKSAIPALYLPHPCAPTPITRQYKMVHRQEYTGIRIASVVAIPSRERGSYVIRVRVITPIRIRIRTSTRMERMAMGMVMGTTMGDI